jgi:twitching motility protein PilI
VIAIEDEDMIVGLAVDRVIGMDWLSTEQIQPVTNMPDNMAPFLRGQWKADPESNPNGLRLLDPVAILRAARWAA